MQRYSTEQAANIAVLIGFALNYFNLNISSEETTGVISAVMILGGIVYSWYKRYQRGDIYLSGIRK